MAVKCILGVSMRGFKAFFCWILFVSVFLFSSCSRVILSPNEAIGVLLAAHSLPSGVVYALDAGDGQTAAREMLSRMLGECEDELGGIRSCAFYLSARGDRCEAAVFACYSASAARELATLCLARGTLLARHDNAVESRVLVKGKTLLWAACANPDPMIDTLARAIN